MKTRADDGDYYPPHLGQSGTLHSVSGDEPERDVVQQLHDVVREVTRRPVPAPIGGFGFLRHQRGFVIPAMLILYAVIALAAIAATAGIAYKAQHWCNAACTEARAERDTLAAEKAAVLKREAAIATLYGQQVAATQAAETKRDEVRHDTFDPIRQRAGAAGRGARLSADALRVLADATSAANAAGATGSADQAPATAATAPDVVSWYVDVAEIHAECRDRVAAWQRFYDGLRAATSEVPDDPIH